MKLLGKVALGLIGAVGFVAGYAAVYVASPLIGGLIGMFFGALLLAAALPD